jgi:hypothetical protein
MVYGIYLYLQLRLPVQAISNYIIDYTIQLDYDIMIYCNRI